MSDLNRCPRCARPRVAAFRYCPACAFDYDTIAENDSGHAEERPSAAWERGEQAFYVRPSPPPSKVWADCDDRAMERDIARYSLARWRLGCRARTAGCLGAVVGFFAGGAIAVAAAPNSATANPFLALLLPLVGAILGMSLGSYWAVRSAAD